MRSARENAVAVQFRLSANLRLPADSCCQDVFLICCSSFWSVWTLFPREADNPARFHLPPPMRKSRLSNCYAIPLAQAAASFAIAPKSRGTRALLWRTPCVALAKSRTAQ